MLERALPTIDRRTLMAGALSAASILAILPTSIAADDAEGEHGKGHGDDPFKAERRKRFEELGYFWQATSPSIHLGDTLTATFTNRGSAPLTIWPSIIIMDHPNHHNESVVDEELELAAGAERVFTAVNNYGVANHFSTRMVTDASDPAMLGIDITIVDASGTLTTQFNERAFWVKSWTEVMAAREAHMPTKSGAGGHDHSS